MTGTWQSLQGASAPSFNVDTMLLLTDGTVLCHEFLSPNWHRLTPDPTGAYDKGIWSNLASLPPNLSISAAQGGPTNAPLYFASAVLRDGRVFVAGGEDNGATKNAFLNTVELYNPVYDAWTYVAAPAGWTQISDAPCCLLSDGRLLLGNFTSTSCAIYDPEHNAWIAAAATTGVKASICGEETWTLLPDGSVLTVECSDTTNTRAAERYVPGLDQWVPAGSTTLTLTQPCPNNIAEIGPAVLLTTGQVFAVGATGNTNLFSPAAPIASAWTAGPPFIDARLNTLYPMDAPACLLPTGNVLCVASPGPPCNYPPPTFFFEYNPTTNRPVPTPRPANSGNACFTGRMLLLPTGQVFYSDGTSTLSIYTPTGPVAPRSAPSITGCPRAVIVSMAYPLNGTQLNGLSQAVSYGDDASAATNYPLVRLHPSGTNRTYYCRTFNHLSMGVATGALPVSTSFRVPWQVDPGDAEIVVIANGVASASLSITVQPCLSLRRYSHDHGINTRAGLSAVDPAVGSVRELFNRV